MKITLNKWSPVCIAAVVLFAAPCVGAQYDLLSDLRDTYASISGLNSAPVCSEELSDMNGAVPLAPNGVIDATEIKMLEMILEDPSLDLTSVGGVAHGPTLAAFEANHQQATAYFAGHSLPQPETARLIAAYVTLGTEGHALADALLSAALNAPPLGSYGDGPYDSSPGDLFLKPSMDADNDGYSNLAEHDLLMRFYPELDPAGTGEPTSGDAVARGDLYAQSILNPALTNIDLVYDLAGEQELYADVATRLLLVPRWSYAGTKILFTSTDATAGGSNQFLTQLRLLDLAESLSPSTLVDETDGATTDNWPCYTVDDAWGFFSKSDTISTRPEWRPIRLSKCTVDGPLQVVDNILDPSLIDPLATDLCIKHASVEETDVGVKMVLHWVTFEASLAERVGRGLCVFDVDASGLPVPGSKVEICSPNGQMDFTRPAMSPSGDQIVFLDSDPWPTNLDVYVVTDILAILAGQASPITSMNDPRVVAVEASPRYADFPSWSEDGTLLFYCEDFNGAFDAELWNFNDTNFDIVVASVANIIAGTPVGRRIPLDGDQGPVCASKGGTRLAYVGGLPVANTLYAASLRIRGVIEIDGAGSTTLDFVLRDGSGSTLSIAEGTAFSDYGAAVNSLAVAVYTPVNPLDEVELTDGVAGIPVLRSFEVLNGTTQVAPTLTPPAELTLTYRDQEIEGLAEAELTVYAYNGATGLMDLELPIVSRDLSGNSITVAMTTFATPAKAGGGSGADTRVGVGGKTDSDGDGLSDETEGALGTDANEADSDHDGLSDYEEVYWDGDGALNPYDEIGNPTGTDTDPWDPDSDGDGVIDGQEVDLGTGPLDPDDTPTLHTTSIQGVGILLMVMLAALSISTRKMIRSTR